MTCSKVGARRGEEQAGGLSAERKGSTAYGPRRTLFLRANSRRAGKSSALMPTLDDLVFRASEMPPEAVPPFPGASKAGAGGRPRGSPCQSLLLYADCISLPAVPTRLTWGNKNLVDPRGLLELPSQGVLPSTAAHDEHAEGCRTPLDASRRCRCHLAVYARCACARIAEGAQQAEISRRSSTCEMWAG